VLLSSLPPLSREPPDGDCGFRRFNSHNPGGANWIRRLPMRVNLRRRGDTGKGEGTCRHDLANYGRSPRPFALSPRRSFALPP
jgi:hypothetical protein